MSLLLALLAGGGAISGTGHGSQVVQLGAAAGTVELLPITGTITGQQLVQAGAGTAVETFAGPASGAQEVQAGAGTGTQVFAGPFTGTISGSQALQTESGAAAVPTIWRGEIVIQVPEPRRQVPAVEGSGSGSQAPATGAGRAVLGITGRSNSTQAHSSSSGHGWNEDEAELLALLLGVAA